MAPFPSTTLQIQMPASIPILSHKPGISWRSIFSISSRSTTSSSSSQGPVKSNGRYHHSSSHPMGHQPIIHPDVPYSGYYPASAPSPFSGPVGPYASCPYHPPYVGYAGWWQAPPGSGFPPPPNTGWTAHNNRNDGNPDINPNRHPHSSSSSQSVDPHSYFASENPQAPYRAVPYKPTSKSSSRSHTSPGEEAARSHASTYQTNGQSGCYPPSRNSSSTSLSHSSAQFRRPNQSSTPQNLPSQYDGPYTQINSSSASFHRQNTRDDSSVHGSFHSAHSSSSLHHPPTHTRATHSNYTSNSRRPLPKTPPEIQSITSYQLHPLLNAGSRYYPSIDWVIWDRIYGGASAWGEGGTVDELNLNIKAFVGKSVRGPIYITSRPGKTDGFSLATGIWGPILVKPDPRDGTIKLLNIMKAMYKWLNTLLEERHWTDEVYIAHVTRAFNTRKTYANSLVEVTGEARTNARVVDTLFCRVRWNGLELSEDFAETKMVYLNLLDIRSELGSRGRSGVP